MDARIKRICTHTTFLQCVLSACAHAHVYRYMCMDVNITIKSVFVSTVFSVAAVHYLMISVFPSRCTPTDLLMGARFSGLAM